MSSFARVLIVLVGLCVGVAGCQEAPLPDPSSEAYQNAVASFYTGLVALQVGELGYAETRLAEVTDQVPQEPAAWANRGVLALRRNAFAEASQYLEQAHELAPGNGHIAFLQGVLARQRGAFAEAAGYLRSAIERDSSNAKALYALAQVIQRQGTEGDSAQVGHLLDRLLALHPGNLVVLLEQARLAAGRGDAETLRRAVGRLQDEQTAAWPAEARERLATLQAAAGADGGDDVSTQIAFLANVLKSLPAYQTDRSLVQSPAGQVGEPVARLLRLPEPDPSPAAPDAALAFTAEPLPAGDSTAVWAAAQAVALMIKQNPETAEALPSAVVADGRRVQIESGPTLPFPGGAAAAPPDHRGIAALDYDYDFERDLVLAGPGGLRLFRHDRAGTSTSAPAPAPAPGVQNAEAAATGVSFTDVTGQLGLPPAVTNASYAGVWPADLDQEGDVDLVLTAPEGGAPRALRNNGDGTFSRWALFEGAAFDEAPSTLRDFAWADLSGDGDPDAVFLDDAGGLYVFENQRAGTFEPVALPAPDHVQAIDAADMNRDGVIDLLALDAGGTVHRLSHQRASGDFDTASLATGLSPEQAGREEAVGGEGAGGEGAGGAQLFAADLDNNGGLDLVASTPAGGRVWLSDAQDQFQPSLGVSFAARVSSVADLDGDGRLELVGLSPAGQAVRLVSQGGQSYQAKSIRPRAAQTRGDRRINPFGLGGEISLRAGLLYQKQPIRDPIVHFGLGTHDRVDVARIVWPNGSVQAEFDLASDQAVLARQRLKGSCPWLFAYDGEKMDFVTDLLWRTSLGLRINAQGTAGVVHSTDWVKVRGDELTPRTDGGYDLRITAELWETHFFDHVALMAVDHPEGTEVFVDERFHLPPPETAVHAMRPPRPVAQAWDDTGRDVTGVVRERDGRYLDRFALGPYQGIAEEHYVEVELGAEAPQDGPLWLVASGWVYPTDSSVNLAVSQGQRPKPKGLRLEVPDGDGGWRVAQPDLGFPAGKNKTVLIDLSDVSFPAGAPRRLRLRTNMEIYWDRLAWAEGRPGAEVRTRRLAARTSTLRHRGFSATRKPRRSFPETPDYAELARTGQQWRDLAGYYTRFGDVRALTQKVDDRYVIMNAGDELALRFEAPPPPPPGWTRDFVFVSDGWVKDGDYNTGHSKTVRPLPYHGLSEYSQSPVPLAQDPAYRKHPDDWQTYHTRYIAPGRFQTALVPD